jgi:hypothetical protein
VLVIIILGVGVFFLAKLFGGGKEIANATDAGTLNLTKQALISPTVTLPSSAVNLLGTTSPTSENGAEFLACAYPPPPTGTPPTINLFTYNRCVAQALLVALNAQQEAAQGSATAVGYAQQVYNDLNTYIGQPLRQALIAGGNAGNPNILQNNFSSGANKNNVSMFGKNAVVNPTAGYQVAYLTRGNGVPGQGSNSTNVAIDPSILPAMPTSGNLATTANGQPGAIAPDGTHVKGYFMGGYVPITAAGINFYGVPVYPGQQPHLVSGQDFKNALNAPDPNVPPNAFEMAASSQFAGNGNMGGAFACAIVGAVAGGPFSSPGLGSNNGVFTASIPSGYIELANLPGAIPAAGFMPTDEQTSIFNNELSNGALGTPVVASSDGTMFALDNGSPASPQAEVNAWVTYNTTVPTPATDPSQGPNPPLWTITSPAVPGNIYDSATGKQKNISKLATAVSFSDNCTAQAQSVAGLTGNCLNALQNGAMENAFGRATNNSGVPTGSPAGNGISAEDWLKGKVIQNFNSGYHPHVTISAASIPYQSGAPVAVPGTLTGGNTGGGMGVYAGNTADTYPSPGVPASAFTAYPTEQESSNYCTVWNMINQVDHGDGTDNASPSAPTEGLHSGPTANVGGGTGQGCSGIFDSLLQRAREIQPSTTPDQLRALLQSHNAYCPTNTTLYIYLPPSAINPNIPDSTQPLMISSAKPASYTGASPDGAVGASSYTTGCYDAAYSLIGTKVDVFVGNPHSAKGDDALHEAPYTQPAGNLMSQDSVGWTASSGYGNLLGRMVFANAVQGSASFSAPN